MPRNQKLGGMSAPQKMVKWCQEVKRQNGIDAKGDFPVPLDLGPGGVSVSGLFIFLINLCSLIGG